MIVTVPEDYHTKPRYNQSDRDDDESLPATPDGQEDSFLVKTISEPPFDLDQFVCFEGYQ